jgi:hypothetical protein
VSSAWWLLAPLAVFTVLLQRHERVLRALNRAARLIAFYDRGLDRLDERWAGAGDPGDRFLDDTHPYAADLDLFGRGSLFELLSLARTQAGEEALARWLKGPATLAAARERHAAIAELRAGLELREALAIAGGEVRGAVDPTALTAWAAAAPVRVGHRPIVFGLTAVLIALGVAAAAAFVSAPGGAWIMPLLVAAVLRTLYQHFAGGQIEGVLRGADDAARELDILRVALEVLERESFHAPALTRLQGSLPVATIRASAAIGRLHRYIDMQDWSHNIMFTPLAALLMWNDHLALAVERWRATYGPQVDGWLRAVGEFEALSSLAAYAYEHPADPFPELVAGDSSTAAAVFAGSDLGHPLLSAAAMVRNDVSLGDTAQLLVVSGSNMSGKSTLLRTVGINAVLALAGAPVRATRLRISPMAIGATLRIEDSLQQGRSRFFAEITRIRAVADLAAAGPLLFLLDELFHGTNSHDRLLGATGVLRSLVARGAIGLITTHDLALTAVTAELGPRARNVHFEDSFDGATMQFDYRMKPGPVTRSNAVALMRAVGLDVPENTP